MREIFVLSNSQVSSIAEWQQAIDKEGFALRLSTSGLFDEMNGHVQARLGHEDAGFECGQLDSAELLTRYSDVDFGHAWKFVRTFRSSSTLKSNIASWIGAATFANVTGGKVFDPQEGKLYAPEEVLSPLREAESNILQIEDEPKKLKEQPREAGAPSPAVINVRRWNDERGEEGP